MCIRRKGIAFLLQVLLLAGSSWQICRAGDVQPFSKLSDGVYTLQLASTNCFFVLSEPNMREKRARREAQDDPLEQVGREGRRQGAGHRHAEDA